MTNIDPWVNRLVYTACVNTEAAADDSLAASRDLHGKHRSVENKQLVFPGQETEWPCGVKERRWLDLVRGNVVMVTTDVDRTADLWDRGLYRQCRCRPLLTEMRSPCPSKESLSFTGRARVWVQTSVNGPSGEACRPVFLTGITNPWCVVSCGWVDSKGTSWSG